MSLSFFAYRTYSSSAPAGTVPFNTYSVFNTDWYWLSYGGTTIEDLIAYYANLLIIQYHDKPKAIATVGSLVRPAIMDQLPLQVQDAFNLTGETAVGVQLDTLGKYVGVTRNGYGFYGPVSLNDSDFLQLINMAIVRNNAGSSLATIQAFLARYFPNQVYVFDYLNMQLGYLIDNDLGSQGLLQLFITEGLLPRPMGVALSVTSNAVINKFFGMRTYGGPASTLATPLQTYGAYDNTWLFMSYVYSVRP